MNDSSLFGSLYEEPGSPAPVAAPMPAPPPVEPSPPPEASPAPEPHVVLPPFLGDDLLPTRSPRRSPSVPARDRGTSLRRVAAPLLVLVLALGAGVGGYQLVSHLRGRPAGNEVAVSSSDGTAGRRPAAVATTEAVKQRLRTLVTAAQQQASARRTFALDPGALAGAAPGVRIVAGPAPGAEPGVVVVSSSAAALCVQSRTSTGATLAAAVTADGLRFSAGGPGGAACTTDPVALRSWPTDWPTGPAPAPAPQTPATTS